MKRIALILKLSLLAMTSLAQSETNFVVLYQNAAQTFMGVDLSEIYTGSGHGSGHVIRTNLQRGRRYLSIGAVVAEDAKSLTGTDVKFKVFLGDKGNPEIFKSEKTHLVPYVHYNCLYHSAAVVSQPVVQTQKKSGQVEMPAHEGRVATIEHFMGVGLQLNLASRFHLDGNLGFGTYIGSLDHSREPQTFGIHKDNYGFVLAAELGVGYSFNL